MKRKVQDELDKSSQKVKIEDLRKTIKKENEFKRKVLRVPSRFKKLANLVKLFIELLKDYTNGSYREIPWGTLSVIVASLTYFLAPIDLLPDILPVIGFIDDALLFTTALSFIKEDLKHYCLWKGYDPEQYF